MGGGQTLPGRNEGVWYTSLGLMEAVPQPEDGRRASVHTLRHTWATHSVRKGTKLDVVRQVLGHSSLATTSIYVELASLMPMFVVRYSSGKRFRIASTQWA
jgi:site-specific recombinase XerD